MHIVFLTSEYPKKNFPHGGVGTVIQNIARGLVKYKHDVSIIGLNYVPMDEIDEDQGVKIYRYKSKKVKTLTWLLNYIIINKAIKKLHAHQPIDIVESTELGLAFIHKIKGIKYLIRMNGGHHFFAESENRKIEVWKAFQEKRSFRKADHVIGVSDYVFRHTSRYIDFKKKYKGVIYNLANLNRFKPADISKEMDGRLFFAGSLCEKKGIRQLIQAFPKVLKEVPHAHLIIAGRDTIIRGTQNSYLAFLKSEIQDDIRDRITFLGLVNNEELSDEIEKAQVCVYPSHMEAMPLAWLEVLSMGKAFIGSNLGPGPEVITDKKTGLMCNPFDLDRLAKNIILLIQNRDLAHQLGKNAIVDMENRFSYKKLMEKNINLYTSILK